MQTDARVSAATEHWGHRFVANGVALADFQDVTAAISRWEDWCAAWCARAAVHEAMGREALDQGHFVSAGEHLNRAGVYYHFANPVRARPAADARRPCQGDRLPHPGAAAYAPAR